MEGEHARAMEADGAACPVTAALAAVMSSYSPDVWRTLKPLSVMVLEAGMLVAARTVIKAMALLPGSRVDVTACRRNMLVSGL